MATGLGTARHAAKGWSESAFELVFLEYYARLVGILCRVVGDRARAEEVASDAFLKLYRQEDAPERYDNVGGWLYRTAIRLGIDAVRAASRRRAHEAEADWHGGAPATPLDETLRAERAVLVRQALAKLKPQQAEILTLRSNGLSYRELSAALGIHLASVGRVLARAEEAFEKAYRRLERTSGLR